MLFWKLLSRATQWYVFDPDRRADPGAHVWIAQSGLRVYFRFSPVNHASKRSFCASFHRCLRFLRMLTYRVNSTLLSWQLSSAEHQKFDNKNAHDDWIERSRTIELNGKQKSFFTTHSLPLAARPVLPVRLWSKRSRDHQWWSMLNW